MAIDDTGMVRYRHHSNHQTMQTTIETLPKRRGVVARANGITDSYGKQYIRMSDGSLRKLNAVTEPQQPLVLGGFEV